MNNKYYRVRIAIDTIANIIIGTTLETVFDYAMPYDKTWFRGKYEFKEKSFESEAEAREFKHLYDECYVR